MELWRTEEDDGLHGYREGFGGGLGLGTPVVSYAPLPISTVVCTGLAIIWMLEAVLEADSERVERQHLIRFRADSRLGRET